MTQEERKARAQKAARFLEDPLVVEALAALDDQYVKIWRDAKTLEAREDAHRFITLLAKFEGHLSAMMSDGVFADSEVRALEGRNRFFGN